jgi:hypothetical protein
MSKLHLEADERDEAESSTDLSTNFRGRLDTAAITARAIAFSGCRVARHTAETFCE